MKRTHRGGYYISGPLRIEHGNVLVVPVEIELPIRRVTEYVERPGVAALIASQPLTVAEERVFPMLVRGLCNKEISAETHLTVSTVKFHVTNILRKFRVGSRIELVARYRERGG